MRERSLRLGLLQVYQRRHSCVGGGGCQGLVAVGHSPTSTRSDPADLLHHDGKDLRPFPSLSVG